MKICTIERYPTLLRTTILKEKIGEDIDEDHAKQLVSQFKKDKFLYVEISKNILEIYATVPYVYKSCSTNGKTVIHEYGFKETLLSESK